ncbi:4Fe-4S dicluster domain-containing protein, partial [Candidatus Calescamantes bacterium]|nr:4Fe-4S dicluster domain-containing protein [Candidatus Calescamantes bacterium]
KVWDEIGEKCVSCGNCTNVCPTCYCFDIIDDINLDLNTGTRTRVWDSCQNGSFAEVAGGENFREDRGERQRHRLNRKFNYPVSKFRRYFCTGCGRCTRACVAGIDLKETINALIEEKKGNENG